MKILKNWPISPHWVVYNWDQFPIKVFPGHKMAKNASKGLKFGSDMYFYVFYQIPKDFGKIFKIERFPPKIVPLSTRPKIDSKMAIKWP